MEALFPLSQHWFFLFMRWRREAVRSLVAELRFHSTLFFFGHLSCSTDSRNAAAFNAQMGPEELVVQLNFMHAELSRRLQTNKAEHHHLWDTIEETKSEVGNLGGKLSNVQHVLDGTTNTARQVIESLVWDSRGALEAVRGESEMQCSSTRLTFALHDTPVAEVTRLFLGVRVELDATQERLRQVGRMDSLGCGGELGRQCWFQASHQRPFAFRAGLPHVGRSQSRP